MSALRETKYESFVVAEQDRKLYTSIFVASKEPAQKIYGEFVNSSELNRIVFGIESIG